MNKLMSMAAMILLLVLGAGCQDDDGFRSRLSG